MALRGVVRGPGAVGGSRAACRQGEGRTAAGAPQEGWVGEGRVGRTSEMPVLKIISLIHV